MGINTSTSAYSSFIRRGTGQHGSMVYLENQRISKKAWRHHITVAFDILPRHRPWQCGGVGEQRCPLRWCIPKLSVLCVSKGSSTTPNRKHFARLTLCGREVKDMQSQGSPRCVHGSVKQASILGNRHRTVDFYKSWRCFKVVPQQVIRDLRLASWQGGLVSLHYMTNPCNATHCPGEMVDWPALLRSGS